MQYMNLDKIRGNKKKHKHKILKHLILFLNSFAFKDILLQQLRKLNMQFVETTQENNAHIHTHFIFYSQIHTYTHSPKSKIKSFGIFFEIEENLNI